MLLKNATVLILSPERVERADLRVQDGAIVARGKDLRPLEEEETVDLFGLFIMPGMVNAHTHLYSALARGMSAPKIPANNFVQILRKIWWKLDQSLDEESIYYSALVGSLEAVKYGATTLIDHHASPNHIKDSLDIIKKAMATVGMRGILCYETTDRGGRRRRNEGLGENERFIAENADNPYFKGTAGAHASFTLNDETMEALGQMSEKYDCGVHIHAAEDNADIINTMKKYGIGVVRRLQKFGALSHKSILAHGIHLPKSQVATIGKSRAWIIHNPRSNMNNAVGYAPLQWFGDHSAIGTDGFPSDMFEESKIGFFRNRESDHRVSFGRLPEMLHAGQKLVSRFFGREFGTLEVGSPADLIVLKYTPPTPLTDLNLLGHFLFGMSSGMVTHTMVNGEWQMWDGGLVGIDEEKIMNEASVVAQRLWKRMEKS